MPTKPLNFQHSDAAQKWSETEERAEVFTVTRRNPERDEWDAEEHPVAEGEPMPEPPAETITETYTVPAKPNPGLGLQYLRIARQDAGLATSWLLETALGERGYDALIEELAAYDPETAQAQMTAITERVQKIVLGGLEAPKG